MNITKSAFWLMTIVWIAGEAVAQGRADFDAASLSGSYALVGEGGTSAASVGIVEFDGAGGATRSLTLNEADVGGAGRLIVEITGSGEYAVNADGTGTASFVNDLPDGSQVTFSFDFVITEARPGRAKGALLGTRLRMLQRESGIAAQLVVFDLSRLRD